MSLHFLQVSAERVDDERVKLRVEVPEEALKPSIDAAYRRWADEIRVPGFRKGKVPRRIIESRVGGDVVREEALREALPGFYEEALRVEDIVPVAPPEIEVVSFTEGEALVFEATVDVRPEIEIPDLGQITVEGLSAEVTDADVDEQLERLREGFAELETVPREARPSDHVLIDLKAYHHDHAVEEASALDLLYEVGSHSGPAGLDAEVEGNRAGAILRFTAGAGAEAGEHAGQELSFTVLIKEVKAKRLPPLDDAFAATAGEFDSLQALRDDLRERLADVKKRLIEGETRGRVLEALVQAASFEPPSKLVEAEFEYRLARLEEDLRRHGVDLSDYARNIDQTELEIRRDLRLQAVRSVKAELLLEEIGQREGVDVTQEDFVREIASIAARTGRDTNEVAEQLAGSGRLGGVAADIMRRKALDYVVANVNIVGVTADR